MANIAKSNTMNFQPGAIRKGTSEEAFSHKGTGEGATYRGQLWRCTPCPDCGVELMDGVIMAHCRQFHKTETDID